MFILDNPFGISSRIWLNSFIKGGNTRIKIVNIITEITVNTINNDRDLGILKPFCNWLHKLHTIFEITNEQIIKSKKSLKNHTINDVTKITVNLKYKGLLNLRIF